MTIINPNLKNVIVLFDYLLSFKIVANVNKIKFMITTLCKVQHSEIDIALVGGACARKSEICQIMLYIKNKQIQNGGLQLGDVIQVFQTEVPGHFLTIK